jgi:transglutaminase-like putative cysteine protease
MNAARPMAVYLTPGQFIDSDHPAIVAKAASLVRESASQLENALTLYYWVRDSIRYNPYTAVLDPASFLASATLEAGEGWCVPKALLLSALCRAVGIPARVGFADVRNHLSTARMRAVMQTDVFYFHGYSVLFLEGRWVKATPAFNIELCDRFGLQPLEFNGREDSLYHPFDRAGNRHMEYLNDRGEYPDLPFEQLEAVFRRHYPGMFDRAAARTGLPDRASWDGDVARETGA